VPWRRCRRCSPARLSSWRRSSRSRERSNRHSEAGQYSTRRYSPTLRSRPRLLEDLGIVGPAHRVRSLRKLADDALYCQTRWMRNRTTCESMLIHTHRRTRSPGLSRLVLRLGPPGIDSALVSIALSTCLGVRPRRFSLGTTRAPGGAAANPIVGGSSEDVRSHDRSTLSVRC
jgi:hypothetical protein